MIKFNLLGIKIHVTFLFAAFLGIILFFDINNIATVSLAAVVIHESGHLAMMFLCGVPPQKIIFRPAGIIIVKNSKINSCRNDIMIVFAGSCSNFICSAAAGLFYYTVKNEYILLFCMVNLAVGIFNLLPIHGLDGGDILNLTLKLFHNEYFVFLIMNLVSLIFIVLLAAVFLFTAITGKINISLVPATAYLASVIFIFAKGKNITN